MPKQSEYDIKTKCGRCTRERYELIQSPAPDDKTFVCYNCWNYLHKKAKQEGEKP